MAGKAAEQGVFSDEAEIAARESGTGCQSRGPCLSPVIWSRRRDRGWGQVGTGDVWVPHLKIQRCLFGSGPNTMLGTYEGLGLLNCPQRLSSGTSFPEPLPVPGPWTTARPLPCLCLSCYTLLVSAGTLSLPSSTFPELDCSP